MTEKTIALVVTQAFGDYAIGERITDPETVAELRVGDQTHRFVPVVVDPLDHDADGRKGGDAAAKTPK